MNDIDIAERFIDSELELFAAFTRGGRGMFAAKIDGLLAAKRIVARAREARGGLRGTNYAPREVPACFQQSVTR